MKSDQGAGIVDEVEFSAMEEPALRSEIYTLPQLESHAQSVAQTHQFSPRKRGNKLLPRLRENERILTRTYQLISDAAARKERVSPASEWLLDNFYLIEKQILTVRSHLPRGYSRELPRLTHGVHTGFPRVYAIAFELISHADGKVDTANIKQFVNAYQTAADLRLGELWAIPIMLRLAIIENLRGVAIRIARSQLDRNAAADWVQRLVKTSDSSSTGVILTLADLSRATPKLSSTFVSELTRQLQDLGQNFSLVHSFIEQRLSEQGTTREESLHEENQRQAADQISIGNCIESLRALDAIDWREFVESSSTVEKTLLGDPLKVYASMDFATRDRYRHVVEKLARRTDVAEAAVAQAAVDCAFECASQIGNDYRKHVGYYLVDDGIAQLEQRIAGGQLLGARMLRGLRRWALFGYVLSIVLISAAFFFAAPVDWRALPLPAAVVLAGVLVLAASQLGVSLANWLATRFAAPNHLSRLDFSKQIPPEYKSVVAVPCMLTSERGIDLLLEKLEIRYLGNRDRAISFALLSDFKDADQQTIDGDERLLNYASAGIEALNKKYNTGAADNFYLFHRARKWNERERRWMGYERKRGKLAEFNHFLMTGEGEFLRVTGDNSVLKGVQFVITLDADTQLPAGSAQKLIGTLAHPLNRPYYDAKKCRVTRGYGILQPTAAVTLPSAQSSWFSQLYGGEPGIDPYTQLVSDVYQDLFGEGSFIGKGIYDLKGFEQTLAGVLPENRILSHDLLEGSYVRCGLATDIQIFEDFPSRYLADTARRHRWMRGDWQIGRWLLPWVPAFGKTTRHNPLALTSKWKIFDNLRRSLVPICFLAALLGGWWFAGHTLRWTAYLLLIPFIPVLLEALVGLTDFDNKSSIRVQLNAWVSRGAKDFARTLLNFAFLPYEAWISIDAVVRTLFRLTITGRKLLEWTTSSEAEQMVNTGLLNTVRVMWQGPLLALAMVAVSVNFAPSALTPAAICAALWLISPLLAQRISLTVRKAEVRLSQSDRRFLRTTARQTWAFFDRFVNADENWLPPDNFQEQPISIIAHRTSPTNMGMALLANLAAVDFGYISVREMIERSHAMLAAMQGLERSRGHFYNWYDTQTLKPLNPLYISTVDSGNLACHLLTLQHGLLELADQPLVSPQMLNGLADTLRVMSERLNGKQTDESALVARKLSELEKKLDLDQKSRPAAIQALNDAKALCVQLKAEFPLALHEAEINWVDALDRQVGGWLEAIGHFAPPLLKAKDSDDVRDWKLSLRTLAATKEGEPRYDAELAYRSQKAIGELEVLADLCGTMAREMEFGFLYVPSKKLFSIGYSVVNHRLDNSCYDLLASEARVASFVAIALGQVDQEHWFALGRQITGTANMATLVSWSGSMFEYLMPLLVMPTYDGTLLDQTYRGVVRQQVAYGKGRGVPWGISESGYNLTDARLNYQYRAFGVPGLGLQRGLGEDLVIAPYASMMALMVAPEISCRNLQRLSADDRVGAFGFYEAIDYTPSRMPPNQESVAVSSYMAHHQGMSLLALDYVLQNKPMQRRFAAEPVFKVADLLLQERVPKAVMAIMPHPAEVTQSQTKGAANEVVLRIVNDPSTPVPELHLLSNGRYHVMVNAAGSGYSRWKDLAVTRFREDAARDSFGLFCYIKDVNTGAVWSTSYQPTRLKPEKYEAIFSEGRVEFRRRDNQIDLHTEISVSAEDDVEIRRTRVTNSSSLVRTLEFTSYGEVVVAPQGADAAHPAFNNLFVQTQIDMARESIICTRRPRATGEATPVLFHSLAVRSNEMGKPTFETSRATFIGRTKTLHDPAALLSESLSGSSGSVLDPIVSIRRTIRLEPGDTVTIDLICGMSDTQEQSIALIDKYRDERLSDRVFDMAWTHAQVALRQLNCTEAEAQLYNKLAGSIIYASQHRRASAVVLAKNRRGQSGLWSYGISGDLPIVMVRISDGANLELVRQCVQAHAFWRMKGLVSDLVLTNDDPSVYRQALYDQIIGLIAAGRHAQLLDKPGGIFVRRAEQISEEDRTLLQTVARVVLSDAAGTFGEQVDKRSRVELTVPLLKPAQRKSVASVDPVPAADSRALKFFNGVGGFSADGSEYVVVLDKKSRTTPAPWVNVIANPTFGTVISESGGCYTWLENSHEYRLTPWSNDPVTDTTGEALYIRDEESGLYWSPTPLPSRGPSPYVVRHGFGYSTFETSVEGIGSTLSVFVAMDAPLKFMRLKLTNKSRRTRKLSAWGYFEWVLAELRGKSHMHISTEIDPRSGAIFARNPYSSDFPGRIAFVSSSIRAASYSGDRTEFIGRNGSLQDPAALSRLRLSGKVGAGLDPCAALQLPLTIGPGESVEVVFELGIGQDVSDVQNLIGRFGQINGAQQALTAAQDFWKETLSGLTVETPDSKVDLLANGWLLYQTLSCRMWARTGFYQSGGAFGFRDQLQDSMALLHSHPALTRQHILMAARHQFREGDVQHWWHTPSGRGVRTHFSDDYLWLPFAACHYAKVTGDARIFDEAMPFVEGRQVNADEESYYDLPLKSEQSGTLYDHCARAIEHGLRFGAHGLPLIGCGDWNDGMNRIGIHGKGESVWLAFFLFEVLSQFEPVARQRGDTVFADRCAAQLRTLKENIEANAWDGDWYRRAYFDDGTPLGSAENAECQIDSLPQSWSILSGAGDPERSRRAMECVNTRLIKRDEQLIQLFEPPFNSSKLEPGYIKGYVPGVRENGGQYTHAALWVIMAFAKLGRHETAWELLSIVNPINHALTPTDMERYKVEPYVVAADVYGVAPHIGRGGWTWYTGSAGWMYRTIIESLLGFHAEKDVLRIQPCVPAEWKTFTLKYQYWDTQYEFIITPDDAATETEYVEGGNTWTSSFKMNNDGAKHSVRVRVNCKHATPPPALSAPETPSVKLVASGEQARGMA